MKIASVILNLGLTSFTLLVLAGDGIPTAPHDVALSVLLLLVPGATALIIGYPRRAATHAYSVVFPLATVSNIVLLAASGWAVVTRFPSHPSEPGLIPFVLMMVGVPALSLVALQRLQRSASAARVLTG